MNHFQGRGFPRRVLLAAAAAVLAGACATQSASSGSPSSTTPPPTGAPGMPPPPSGSPGTEPSGTPSTPSTPKPGGYSVKSGTETSPAGDPAADPAAKAPPAGDPSGDATAKAPPPQGDPGQGEAGARSDEEILAEALEELERRNAGAKPGQATEGEQAPGASGTPGEPGTPGGPVATDEEKVQALHRELNEKFAKFDKTILSETETVKREDDATGNRGFTDRDPFETGEGPDQTAAVDPDAGGTPSPLPKSLPGEMDPAGSSRSDIPPDLVSAEGDDIIARQLREAAMKEQDPELRAKLWDEYRKYKRGM